MEPCAQKTTKKHNPELVDTVFRLMFEILWVAPYDRRRSNAALSEFERRGRETAVLLAATDLRSASPGELQTLLQAVGRLESEALFSRWQCAEALAQVRRIAAIVQEHAAVAVG
mgnify:FL=1